MNCVILSMLSKSAVFRKAMAAKQTNIIMLDEPELMHSIYSIKILATWRRYTNCEAMRHPNNNEPQNTRPLNRTVWLDVLLTPRCAYRVWIVCRIFISLRVPNFTYEFGKTGIFSTNLDRPWFVIIIIFIWFFYQVNYMSIYECTFTLLLQFLILLYCFHVPPTKNWFFVFQLLIEYICFWLIKEKQIKV